MARESLPKVLHEGQQFVRRITMIHDLGLKPTRQGSRTKGESFMTIRIVRLGTPRAAGEGLRVGTVRRPPRGVPKEPVQALVGSSDGLSAAGAKLTF